MSVPDIFRKSLPPAPRIGQYNPKDAQKTPWLAHLHPRLRGNNAQEGCGIKGKVVPALN
jgi:hypothetical protein